MGNDLFDMAVERPRIDDVNADHGVTGSSMNKVPQVTAEGFAARLHLDR